MAQTTLTPIDQLDLMDLPIEDRAFGADPEPWFAKARDRHPWLARFSHGYLVHGHRAVHDLMRMDDKLQIATAEVVELMGATGTPWGQFMLDLMIARRGADHLRMRGPLEAYFKPKTIVKQLGAIREIVTRLLDEWAPKGAFDFTEFASNFPVAAMFALIGADLDDLPRIKWALEVQGLSYSLDPTLLPDMERAHALMMDYGASLVKQRRAGGETRADLLQELIAIEDAGTFSHQEVCEQLFFLFAAGYDTSKNELSLIVHQLIQQPALWQRCAESREFCVLAVEEGFRHTSPSAPPRTVLEDVVYEGVLIPEGSHLMFLTNIAGRDPRSWPDPMRYDPDREQVNRHVAFGRGAHQCIGMHLARFQIEEGLHLMAQRLKNPRIAGQVTWRRFPGVWGLETLPIRFTPA